MMEFMFEYISTLLRKPDVKSRIRQWGGAILFWGALFVLTSSNVIAMSAESQSLAVKSKAELAVKELIEPLTQKYCTDQCKILSINASVELSIPEQTAPGFDEVSITGAAEIVPSEVRVKLLLDNMLGPNSRKNLLDLMQKHMEGFPYPVQFETEVAKFPQPASAAKKISEIRDKISKEFQANLSEIFSKFCPEKCLMADYQLETDPVNLEEAQYGTAGEFYQEGEVALRLKKIGATVLLDNALPARERTNILELVRLKTSHFKNVDIRSASMRFPNPGDPEYGDPSRDPRARGLASTSEELKKSTSSNSETTNSEQTNKNQNTTSTNSSQSQNESKYSRIEKIERVESGDAVQKELQKFKVFGLIFACSVIALLIFVALAVMRPKGGDGNSVTKIISSLTSDPMSEAGRASAREGGNTDRNETLVKRYEIERLTEELSKIFAEMPKVAKQVFSRVLTEEGVETTSAYVTIFGEAVVLDMLRDPSLQSDLTELMEFHAKNPMEIDDDDKLELLKNLYNRTISAKMYVLGNRSSGFFDFLIEMDDLQIMDLVSNESLTVKAVILTQVDPQKRQSIYSKLDNDTRFRLLTELSRIDHLPKDYIHNVASALKRKRKENPRLNTESLPGSDVLVNLLERTGYEIQRNVLSSLESSNPDSARVVKNKLVSIDTLRFLRDNQLLEVVLSLRHDELLHFLKGAQPEVVNTIFEKSPGDLVAELQDEISQMSSESREVYQAVERKVINRIKAMAIDGSINLIETNERMFTGPMGDETRANLRSASGW